MHSVETLWGELRSCLHTHTPSPDAVLEVLFSFPEEHLPEALAYTLQGLELPHALDSRTLLTALEEQEPIASRVDHIQRILHLWYQTYGSIWMKAASMTELATPTYRMTPEHEAVWTFRTSTGTVQREAALRVAPHYLDGELLYHVHEAIDVWHVAQNPWMILDREQALALFEELTGDFSPPPQDPDDHQGDFMDHDYFRRALFAGELLDPETCLYMRPLDTPAGRAAPPLLLGLDRFALGVVWSE